MLKPQVYIYTFIYCGKRICKIKSKLCQGTVKHQKLRMQRFGDVNGAQAILLEWTVNVNKTCSVIHVWKEARCSDMKMTKRNLKLTREQCPVPVLSNSDGNHIPSFYVNVLSGSISE